MCLEEYPTAAMVSTPRVMVIEKLSLHLRKFSNFQSHIYSTCKLYSGKKKK